MDSQLAVAAIAATLQAVQTWYAAKDAKKTTTAYAETIESAQAEPETKKAAADLVAMAPPDIVDTMYRRTRKCWLNYKRILKAPDGEYLPAEIDAATAALKACVCRELRRLRDINGSLPDGLMSTWYEQYRCATRESPGAHKQA